MLDVEGWKPQRGRARSHRCPSCPQGQGSSGGEGAHTPLPVLGVGRLGPETPPQMGREGLERDPAPLPPPRPGTKAGGGTRRRPDSAGRGGAGDTASLKPGRGPGTLHWRGRPQRAGRASCRVSVSAPLWGGRRAPTRRTRFGAACLSNMGLPRRAGDPAELRKVGAGGWGLGTGGWGRSL